MRTEITREMLIISAACFFFTSCGIQKAQPLSNTPPPLAAAQNPEALKQAKESGDSLRNNPEVAAYLSDPAFTAVTHDYGATVISTRDFPFRSAVAAAPKKPWSAWWYPKKEDFIFRDRADNTLSPLTKYDKVRLQKHQDSGLETPAPESAVEFERKNFDPHALAWEGLCDAWAFSSIYQQEPRKPVTFYADGKEITFTVADMKALLLKTYEAVDDTSLKYYGQRFTGDERGWIYPDIFPDQFHRFIEVQLIENNRPFIMDHDAGPQVWNVPVYKVNYLMENVPGQPDSVFVTTWIYYASSTRANEKDFIGTKEVVREYQYMLEGKRDAAGNLVVNSGHWMKNSNSGDSRKDHPDYVIQLPDSSQLTRKSVNPEIDPKLVDEILAKSYE